MYNLKKTIIGDNQAVVYVLENPPPGIDTIINKAIAEAKGKLHKFEGGNYAGMSIKEAVYKDGKSAILEISKYLKEMTDVMLFNELQQAIKFFIKSEKYNYTLEDIFVMRHVFEEEIKEYEENYSINIEYELPNLPESEKEKIKNYLLF